MDDADVKPRYARKILGEDIADASERKSSTSEWQHTAQALSLHMDFRDGRSSEGVSWAHYVRYRWADDRDHETLKILFGPMCGVEITGIGLQDLVEEIRHGKLNGIAELVQPEGRLLPHMGGQEPIIFGIKAYPDFDELFEQIKAVEEEKEHEAGHVKRARGR